MCCTWPPELRETLARIAMELRQSMGATDIRMHRHGSLLHVTAYEDKHGPGQFDWRIVTDIAAL